MWKIITFNFLLFSNSTQASLCNTYLSTIPTQLLLKKEIVELTTPHKDSTERVKLLLQAAQESWLNHGRPDRLSTKTLKPLLDEHLKELIKIKEQTEELNDRFEKVKKELEEISKNKYIDQKRFFHWAREAAELNQRFFTVKTGRGIFNNPFRALSYSHYGEEFSRLSFIPVPYANIHWSELNDLWVAGIAIAAMSTEEEFVDGDVMQPHEFTIHDYGHASRFGQNMPFYSPVRVKMLHKASLAYKKFRELQSKEKDLRKRSIREGIMFYALHDSDLYPFRASFNTLLTDHEYVIKNKFIHDEADYGSSFEPEVDHKEVKSEINWLINNLKWDN